MNSSIKIDDIQKIGYVQVIREDLNTLLGLADIRRRLEKKSVPGKSEMACLIHVLGVNYLYKLYTPEKNPYIDYYFDRINTLLREAAGADLIDRMGALLLSTDPTGPLFPAIHDIETCLASSSGSSASAGLEKILMNDRAMTDRGRMILVYLIDCYHDLSGRILFSDLKENLLKSMEDPSVAVYSMRQGESDLQRYLRTPGKGHIPVGVISPLRQHRGRRVLKSITGEISLVYRNIIMLEKAPLILGVLFLAVGYSISYVFSEYKGRPILQYTSHIREISRDSLARSEFNQKILDYWSYRKKDIDTIRIPGNDLEKTLAYCGVPVDDKRFYIQTLQFKNISFNQNIQTLQMTFLLDSFDMSIVYGNCRFGGKFLTQFTEDHDSLKGPNSYHLAVESLPTDNDLEITLVTNYQGTVPLLLDGVSNLILLRPSFIAGMIDNWLATIVYFLAGVGILVIIYFISYSKFKKDAK